VRTIVENCGGKVWAENRPGGGAVVRFTLPLNKARTA
jgi:signal transduction histidine kinase